MHPYRAASLVVEGGDLGILELRVGLEAGYDRVLPPTLIALPKEGRAMTGTDADTPPAPGRMNGGDEIRKIREGQGFSQRRLAKLADVDRASLLRFEKGELLLQPRHGPEVAEVHTHTLINCDVCAIDCTDFQTALRGAVSGSTRRAS
jgi:DNA-binding XRE family transcriptional regulator